jgi:hypothetical protein
MLSESARTSSAAEARFRVQAANSKGRAIKVVAVDRSSESVVRRLAKAPWNHAAFFTASSEQTVDRYLTDLSGRTSDVMTEVEAADLVMMVATPSGHAHAASIIGEACTLKGVMTTALIFGAASASDEALSKTLAQLRPWSLMVVIADADDYVDDLLTALRA